MAENITISNDQIVTVPISFADVTGSLPAPTSGGSVSVDHPFVSAYLTPDDQNVIVTPIANGIAVITYTNGAISDTLTVTVVDPVPTSVIFLTESAVLAPKLNKWNATFSAEFTLSNGGKTATTNVNNHTSTIIGTFSRVNEKVYFEMVSGPSNADLAYGIATGTIGANALIGSNANSLSLRSDGHWLHSNGQTDSGIGSVNNIHLGFAVNLNTGEIYVRNTATPNAWFGAGSGADPVAGTGGFDFTAFTAPVFTAFTSNQNGAPESATVISRAADFVAAPPAGYVAWA